MGSVFLQDKGEHSIVHQLVDRGADAFAQDALERTPFSLCITNGNLPTFRLFCAKYGPSLQDVQDALMRRDNWGKTCMNYAGNAFSSALSALLKTSDEF